MGLRKASAVAAALGLLAAGCKENPKSGGGLLSQVKVGLSERDAKLQSYRLAGTTRQQGQEAQFAFEYRTPNKMKGQLKAPVNRTFSYDGSKVYELVPDEKKLITYENKLPPEKSALFLTQIFSPFAPEGFRAPLLMREGIEAQRIEHPMAKDAVEVKMTMNDDSGQPLTVTYVLRWPALDFLEKRTESATGSALIRVDEEQCDAKLKMCLPKKLSQWEGKNPIASTAMSEIALNPELPNESFSLTAPEGFVNESHSFNEAKPSP